MTDKDTAALSESKEAPEPKQKKRIGKSTVGLMIFGLAAILVLVSTLFLPVIQISGDSMEPMFDNGDLVLLYKTKNFERGDLCCVSWQNKLLLKRVIGLPGDTVDMDEEGNVYINDELLDEPYITEKSLGECDIAFPYTVTEDKIFMLGDHRSTSIDSRCSDVGCIEKKQVIGQVLKKIWPVISEK